VAKVFGTSFAEALFKLAPGGWRGPIESGFGWHLVWVDSIEAGRVPGYEEIQPALRSAWLDAQRAESRRRAFDAMRARYQVVLPSVATRPASEDGVPGGGKSP
jgi:parvulin-like peptidyl-prolyl isomerase